MPHRVGGFLEGRNPPVVVRVHPDDKQVLERKQKRLAGGRLRPDLRLFKFAVAFVNLGLELVALLFGFLPCRACGCVKLFL